MTVVVALVLAGAFGGLRIWVARDGFSAEAHRPWFD